MAAKRAASDPVAPFQRRFEALVDNVATVIQGKQDVIRLALTCLVAEGHLLVEDVPGVGKTTLAKAVARSMSGSVQRIQFTPDLLPSDVTGVSVWNQANRTFEFRPGPVFANVTLADEINRASPRTQSALLEAMEERQVTVDGITHPLEAPFMVIATQNPIEHEGTYQLPEAQLDRFLMRIEIGYPDRGAALDIMSEQPSGSGVDDLSPVVAPKDLLRMSKLATGIHVATSLQEYVLELTDATRQHPSLALGVSPRGALALQRCARAWAAAEGRDFVVPDDVKALTRPVLGHRMLLTAEAQLRGVVTADVLDEIVETTPVPRNRPPR